MQLAFADSLNASLARLTAEEQRAVKLTLLELQLDPSQPGLQYHKLSKIKDPRFASVRVNQDIRIIVHRDGDRLLVMYVDHHDRAYAWAERRKVEQHPVTGSIQVFKVVEQEKVVVVPRLVEQTPFGHLTYDQLLGYGVPPEYLDEVRGWREADLDVQLLRLPAEAAEALFALHTGFAPDVAPALVAGTDALTHPDSQRRFRLVSSSEEMQSALEFPWDQWLLFLHPSQRSIVDAIHSGPFRVSGSAGTGKTIVALHRAVALLRRYPNHRVLLTTFSDALAERLRDQARKLLHSSPSFGERLDVQTLSAMARRLIAAAGMLVELVDAEQLRAWLSADAIELGLTRYTPHFLWSEWVHVIDAWQITDGEGYRAVPRLGRKARLSEALRRELWPLFARSLGHLKAAGLVTEAQLYAELASSVATRRRAPYDHIIVDEAQDLSVPQLRLIAAIASREPEGLFFAGDMGQRIFQPPFSWKSLGVDIRGRSKTLKVNYRTSQEIRRQVDQLHGRSVADVDGNEEVRAGTLSVFSGPDPAVRTCSSEDDEARVIGDWLREITSGGVPASQVGVFARDESLLVRVEAAVRRSGLPVAVVERSGKAVGDGVCLATMHLAKGLEFRAVAVVACDDEVIPSAGRIESANDPGELEEIFESERQLLYVACTRAREWLLVTGVRPVSEFLRDLA
jgi:hypothetical protein